MEIRHLKYFQAVAREKSFVSASHFLRVAQPALSRQIRDLEEELRVELFVRSSKGVNLTEEGIEFLRETDIILSRLESAIIRTRLVNSGECGLLRIGIYGSIHQHPAYDIIADFKRKFPDVQIEISDAPFEEKYAALHAQLLDVAFFQKPFPHELSEYSIEEVAEIHDEVMIALSIHHSLAQKKELQLTDLLDSPLVVESIYKRPHYQLMLNEIVKKTGKVLDSIVQVPNLALGLAMLEDNKSWLVVPKTLTRWNSNQVKYLPIKDINFNFKYGIFFEKTSNNKAAKYFKESILKYTKGSKKM